VAGATAFSIGSRQCQPNLGAAEDLCYQVASVAPKLRLTPKGKYRLPRGGCQHPTAPTIMCRRQGSEALADRQTYYGKADGLQGRAGGKARLATRNKGRYAVGMTGR